MARITPSDWQQLDCLHAEEKNTIAWLEETLPDDYDVFAALGWAAQHGAGGAYYGEVDAAVVSPAGKLLFIEQKNGGLKVEDGELIKLYGEKSKSVLGQIRRSVDAAKRQWSEQGHKDVLPVEYLIYLPDYRVHDVHAIQVQENRVIDRARKHELPDRIRVLLDGAANPDLREQVLDFLRGVASVTMDADIASLRVDQRYQTEGMALAATVTRLQFSPWRLRVHGRAGSGKTLIGQALFREVRQQQQRVLYLCYNRPLADGLAKALRAPAQVMTVDSLTAQLLPEGVAFNTETGMPDFERARAFLLESPLPDEQRQDVVIVDEGQDFSGSQAQLVEHVLKPGGRLLWLEDSTQNLYQKSSHTPQTTVQLDLHNNYRCGREIVDAINFVLQLDPPDIASAPVAGTSPVLLAAAKDKQAEAVQGAIQRLLDQGFALADIVVLSYHGLASSTLLQQERIGPWKTRRFTGQYDSKGSQVYSEGVLRVESVHRFKGLQSPAVVLAELDFEKLDDRARARLYVGMTRARLALTMVMTPEAEQVLFAGRV